MVSAREMINPLAPPKGRKRKKKHELKEKHGAMFDTPRLHLWAHMIANIKKTCRSRKVSMYTSFQFYS